MKPKHQYHIIVVSMISKKIILVSNIPEHKPGAQPELFQGRGSFVESGHFDKYFVKKHKKKRPAGKIWEFFLLDTLKPMP